MQQRSLFDKINSYVYVFICCILYFKGCMWVVKEKQTLLKPRKKDMTFFVFLLPLTVCGLLL